MSTAKDTFCALLKTAGYSLTQARLTVFGALEGQEPLSMHQLVERVDSIDRASVYRAIELFERLGIVQRLNTGWKYKIELTDKFSAHHHHVTCTHCGKTVALEESELETSIDVLARRHGFIPEAHQIEIQGICQSCQAKSR
jgi:Fur family ferric uptake transcriptional regulator